MGGADPSAQEPAAHGDPNVEPLPDAPTEPIAPPTAATPRIPLVLSLAHASSEVFRGQSIEIGGSASSAEGHASGLRVEVLLRDRRGGERLLGVTVTDANGNYHGTFGVPPDSDVGEHVLLVRTPGDAHLLPATAE